MAPETVAWRGRCKPTDPTHQKMRKSQTAEYCDRYVVQRLVGKGTTDPSARVFLVSRAVDGVVDPHRPPLFHHVSTRPPLIRQRGQPAVTPGQEGTAPPGTRLLNQLGRFSLYATGSDRDAPGFDAVTLEVGSGLLHVTELEAPPCAFPLATTANGARVVVLHRRLSFDRDEILWLDGWVPLGW